MSRRDSTLQPSPLPSSRSRACSRLRCPADVERQPRPHSAAQGVSRLPGPVRLSQARSGAVNPGAVIRALTPFATSANTGRPFSIFRGTFGRGSFQQNNAHGLVFTRPDGVPLHPDVVSKTFREVSERANLPRIRFHDLPRTHGSLLLQQGTPLHVVSRRLGHASAAFTADVYADVLPGQAGDAVSKLAESLGPQVRHSIT